MKRNIWVKGVALLCGCVLAKGAMAADHADGPAASADKATDITDIFAWVKGTKTYLVMDLGKDVQSGDKFSNVAQYVFHTTSAAAYGAPTKKPLDVICTFNTAQKVQCWAGDKEYVTGDASTTAGISNSDGSMKVFTGIRNDPFFFNLTGFKAVAATVSADKGALTAAKAFDKDGCPALDPATVKVLVNGLKTNPASDGGPAVNTFATFNVLAIVIEIDTSILTTGGPIVGVWGSTNK